VLNEKAERQIRGLPDVPDEEIQNAIDAAELLGGAGPPATPASGDAPPANTAQPGEPAPAASERLARPNGTPEATREL
jgi:hypothetical protein